jgi:hypothetical protein
MVLAVVNVFKLMLARQPHRARQNGYLYCKTQYYIFERNYM